MPNSRQCKPDDRSETANVKVADSAAIRDAASLIRAGQLVAFPTETVYGLGADATSGTAVAQIFEAKGRPRFNPLIVHVPDVGAAERLGRFSPLARRLADAFWPGPVTLVVPRAPDCAASLLVSAGLDTIALRMPDHPVARALLAASERPLAAPSANRSGHVSATTAEHVASDLGSAISMILDGGRVLGGIESTVIGLADDEPALLRPGAISAGDIEKVLGRSLIRLAASDAKSASPGRLQSHYAPRARLRLDATSVREGEALLAFGPNAPQGATNMLNLSQSGSLSEASSNLFAHVRSLDATGAEMIAVMEIPDEGLGEAINDRLRRAAAPRDE